MWVNSWYMTKVSIQANITNCSVLVVLIEEFCFVCPISQAVILVT